jgi:hypothetical protein
LAASYGGDGSTVTMRLPTAYRYRNMERIPLSRTFSPSSMVERHNPVVVPAAYLRVYLADEQTMNIVLHTTTRDVRLTAYERAMKMRGAACSREAHAASRRVTLGTSSSRAERKDLMFKKLSLVALTSLVAAGSALAVTGAPAAADGLSINLGVPGVYVNHDDYRYQHDRAYREGYDRWRGEENRREREARWRDDHHDWHRDDRGR